MKKLRKYNRHLKHTYQILETEINGLFYHLDDVKIHLGYLDLTKINEGEYDLIVAEFPSRQLNYHKKESLENYFFVNNLTYKCKKENGKYKYQLKIEQLIPIFEKELSINCDLPEYLEVDIEGQKARFKTEELDVASVWGSSTHFRYTNGDIDIAIKLYINADKVIQSVTPEFYRGDITPYLRNKKIESLKDL